MSAPRFEDLSPDDYTPEQQAVAVFFLETGGSEPEGPFKVLLRSFELLKCVHLPGAFMCYACALSGRLSDFPTLCVAPLWSNDCEWVVLMPIARKSGVTDEI